MLLAESDTISNRRWSARYYSTYAIDRVETVLLFPKGTEAGVRDRLLFTKKAQ